MKCFVLALLSFSVAPVVLAQGQNPVAQPPSVTDVQMDAKTHCYPAHAGDIVNYTLKIRDLALAQSVYAELQMRPGRHGHMDTDGLPLPGSEALNGGGTATRDPQDMNVYHVTFRVPAGVTPGVYHGVGVNVTVNDQASSTAPNHGIDVSRHTLDQIRGYCLAVFGGTGSGYPEVIDFKPDSIERKQ